MKKRLAGTVIAVIVVVFAIGILTFTSFDGKSANAATPSHSTTHKASRTSIHKVLKPWRQGTPQLGIDLLWYIDNRDEPNSQIASQAKTDMNYIVGLNANSVDIVFPFYTGGNTSSAVFAGKNTPKPAQLAVAIKAATNAGLRVTIRPLLDQTSLGTNAFRGDIKPTDISAWFASYIKFLHPYLVTAQANRVATFVVGAELNSLGGEPQWQDLISQARETFHAQLAYSANWDAFSAGDPSPPVDRVGVDAYFPVKVSNDASVGDLVNAWDQWWNGLPKGIDPTKTVIDEVGIAAQNGTYQLPYVYSYPNQPLNLSVQTNWFKTACYVVGQMHIAGIYFWNVDFVHDPKVLAMPMSFVGRPGAMAIKSCFATLNSLS